MAASANSLRPQCLLAIAIHKPEDVRSILKAYAGKDVAIEYAKKEAESKRKHIEEWERQGGNKSVVGGFTMSSLFGGVIDIYLSLASAMAYFHFLLLDIWVTPGSQRPSTNIP